MRPLATQEHIFRAAMTLGFALVFPVALYHRVRSEASKEKLDRTREGTFILATLRPLGLIHGLALMAYLVHPPWLDWSSLALPTWLRYLGIVIGAFAAALLLWVFPTIGTNITDTVVTRQEHALVTGGPYRWVRHPFYLAFGLVVVANSLVTANWFVAITGAALVALIVKRTDREEAELLRRFGSDYQRYMQTTPRFFPVTDKP